MDRPKQPRFDIALWEHDEWVVTMDGKPIGMTATEANARGAAYWLNRGGWQLDVAPHCAEWVAYRNVKLAATPPPTTTEGEP